MHKPDQIEGILARLMPAAMSDEGQRGIETLLDELEAESPCKASATGSRAFANPRRWLIGGIAAALAGVAALIPDWNSTPPVVAAPERTLPPGFVLLSESDRIESSFDEGWVENSDGSAMHALRLSVVGENSIRDQETGIVIQVSEPREEFLLMPVSAF
jgi:hypothetical protein